MLSTSFRRILSSQQPSRLLKKAVLQGSAVRKGSVLSSFQSRQSQSAHLIQRLTIVPCESTLLRVHVRQISVSSRLSDREDRSVIERTIALLRTELEEKEKERRKQTKLVLMKKDEGKVAKKSLWYKAKAELAHYYHGFRLMFIDIRISSRLLWQLLRGNSLNRKERRQLVRTVSDLFRLVPFSIFIIIPFMEFLLPVAVKLFPSLLPSTFQERSKQEEKTRRQLIVKLEMAKFLQAAVEEMALERRKSGAEQESSKALEFAKFIKKVRQEGGYVSNKELLKFTKLFEDELTLDNLTHSQLRALCKIVVIQPIGTPNVLRFRLNMKLRELIADDKMIALEGGVEKLSVAELQAANRARGMRALGLSVPRLKNQLAQWLELSLDGRVPPSLLLLSRAMYLPDEMSFHDQLKNLFKFLPDSVPEEARLKLSEMEGDKVDNKAKLKFLLRIEDALMKEKEAEKKSRADEAVRRLKEEKEAKEAALAEALAKASEPLSGPQDTILAGQPAPAPDVAVELDSKDLREIEEILHEAGGKFHEEKEDLADLKEQLQEHLEDVAECELMVKEMGHEAKMTKAAKRLEDRVHSMISGANNILDKLHQQRLSLQEQIKTGETSDESKKELININELVMSLKRIQKLPNDTKEQRVLEVLNSLDSDHDGAIDLELALEVIELLGKGNVKCSTKQMGEIRELLEQEQFLEEIGEKSEVRVDKDAVLEGKAREFKGGE